MTMATAPEAIRRYLTHERYLWYLSHRRVKRSSADAAGTVPGGEDSRGTVEAVEGEVVIYFSCPGARIWPICVASLIKPDLGISLKQ